MPQTTTPETLGEWARMRWSIGSGLMELDLVIAPDPDAMLRARPELATWARVDTRDLPINVTIWARPSK